MMNPLEMLGLSIIIISGIIGIIVISVSWISLFWKLGNSLNKWLSKKLGYEVNE